MAFLSSGPEPADPLLRKIGALRFVAESRGPAACSATAPERGWLDHSAAVAVSVSRQQAGLPISSQLTGNMMLLLPARPPAKQPGAILLAKCGPSEVGTGYVLRYADSNSGRTNRIAPSSPSPELAVSTGP